MEKNLCQHTQSGSVGLEVGSVAEANLNLQAANTVEIIFTVTGFQLISSRQESKKASPDLWLSLIAKQTYQTLLPQFLLLRSISFGENLISFWTFITGRALREK